MKSEGKCSYCSKLVSAVAMSKHLASCIERKKYLDTENGNDYILLIRASAGPFFVYFEANADSTLEVIDSFLRGLWLECCGHLSAFNINGTRYNSDCEDLEPDEKMMDYKLSKILSVNTVFSHEYDFGTTTTLNLKVIAKRKGTSKKIDIIARNILPDFKCKCENPAKEICTQCLWDGEGFLCRKCAKKHKCGEEMLLPVVNSPRMGMCGYTGED